MGGAFLVFLLFFFFFIMCQLLCRNFPHSVECLGMVWMPWAALDVTSQAKLRDMIQAPSNIFYYSHYFGDVGVTLGAERPILSPFEYVGLVLGTAPLVFGDSF